MTRSQQQLAILVVLVGVMIAVYAKALRPRSEPDQRDSESTPPVVATVEAAGEAFVVAAPSTQRGAQRERAMQLAWARDPFVRGGSLGHMSGLSLTGIMWDSAQPIAIINGQMMRVGDGLEGYRIEAITQDRVSVTDGTETFQLRIAP